MIFCSNSQAFTTSGIFIVPADTYCIYVTAIAAGSHGEAGVDSTPIGGNCSAGGSGAYCVKAPITVSPGENIAVVIGVAGVANFGGPYTTTFSPHVYGEPVIPNYIGYTGTFGGRTTVKNLVLDPGQPAFWSISFGHPWAGSGGGNGAAGWNDNIRGAMANEIVPGRGGLATISGWGAHRYFGGASGGGIGSNNGLPGGGSPSRILGGAAGIDVDGGGIGNAGSGGGASLWGPGGDGGSVISPTGIFHHNAAMDGQPPPVNAYGAGGGGGAMFIFRDYGLGAQGRPGYVVIAW